MELRLDFLLHLVLGNALPDAGVLHTLLVALPAVMSNKAREALGLYFARDQLLDKRDIDAHPIGYPARPDLVGVELGHDMNLLFP